jgi:solute carrier family 13 (sodium-dependent dicarboxylate transporter), member 2/3/5
VLRSLLALGACVAALLSYLALDGRLDELERRAAAVFTLAAISWASRPIPLFATSLVVVVASILLLAEEGGLAPAGGISAQHFLEPFGSNIIMLFFGGLVLSSAMSRHALDRAIATHLLRRFAARPLHLIYAVMGISAFLSMWMSNTATTAMMLAIVGSLLRDVAKQDRFGIGLVLAVAMGANIGGVGTPIGTPPNAIALAALRGSGYEVTFLRWMIMAVPLALLLLAIAGAVIYRLYRPSTEQTLTRDAEASGLSRSGWATLGVLILAIAGWLTSGWHAVPDGVVALGAAMLLAALGLVGKEQIKEIDWTVLILMWGGLSLGAAMQSTGLVDHVAELPFRDLPNFLLAGVVVGIALGLSTFISNTATAALLVPLVLALAVPEEGLLVVVTALACSFAMVLPVSTPPNALLFSTERLQVSDIARVGAIMALVAVTIVMLGYRIMVPLALQPGP